MEKIIDELLKRVGKLEQRVEKLVNYIEYEETLAIELKERE